MENIKYYLAMPCLCGLFLALASGAAEAGPRLYIEVRGAKLSESAKCGLKTAKATENLVAAFKKHPMVTTDLGPVKPGDLQRVLKARGLTGYGVLLRVTKCSHEVLPPPKGKVYRVLMVEVGVAIDAEKIPSGQMALAGEGSSQVGTEISRVKEKERLQLLGEALAAATKQAVDRSIEKLTQKKSRRSRRKRRRR